MSKMYAIQYLQSVIPEARAELWQISVLSLASEAQELPGLRLRGETAQKRGFIFLSVSGAARPTKEQDWGQPWIITVVHAGPWEGVEKPCWGSRVPAGQVTSAQQEQAELLQSEQKCFHRLDWGKWGKRQIQSIPTVILATCTIDLRGRCECNT